MSSRADASVPSTTAYLRRQLAPVCDPTERTAWFSEPGRLPLRIMTWNILAQCLVKRELFPGCDCLKWKQRGQTITKEVVDYDPDIVCLQEVDRISDHGPALEAAGYDYTHVIGGYEDEGKQHGLLIGWKRTRFNRLQSHMLRLDEESLGSERVGPSRPTDEETFGFERVGLSRSTRNVGLFCALESKEEPRKGIIIGTAHLFWHARFAYERVRQAGFLSRGIQTFRKKGGDHWARWPTFLAGDFNDQPGGPAYRLMTGLGLDAQQRKILQESTLVHRSVDVLAGHPSHEYQTVEGDEDRVFKDVRIAKPEDGLFDELELKEIYGARPWISLYGKWGAMMEGEDGNWFMNREEEAKHFSLGKADDMRKGGWEPMWTNFTPLWRCTLDYIFMLDDNTAGSNGESQVKIASLLPTHRTQTLEPGLPRLNVEPSDHIPLLAELLI